MSIAQVPKEICRHILSFLDPKAEKAVSETNKFFHSIIHEVGSFYTSSSTLVEE